MRNIDKDRCEYTKRQTDKQTDRQTDKQRDRDRQTDRQTDKQTDTDRQTDTPSQPHTETDSHTPINKTQARTHTYSLDLMSRLFTDTLILLQHYDISRASLPHTPP